MKCGAVHLICLSLGLGLVAPPTIAERNLIPSLDSVPDICPQRPNEPEWMQNIPLRDAYISASLFRTSTARRAWRRLLRQSPANVLSASQLGTQLKARSKKTMPTLVGQK